MIYAICCVCNKKYDKKDDGKVEIIESHGYCNECFPVEMEKIKKMKTMSRAQRLILENSHYGK